MSRHKNCNFQPCESNHLFLHVTPFRAKLMLTCPNPQVHPYCPACVRAAIELLTVSRSHQLRQSNRRLIVNQTLLTVIVSILTVSRAFHSLFKVLFIFPSRYLYAIGLVPVFSFRWNLPPILGCIPKQPDSGESQHALREY